MIILANGFVENGGRLDKKDVLIDGEKIVEIADRISKNCKIINCEGCWIIPAAVDMHAHFREPGFERKGTIKSESESAAKGGIVTAMAMPNLCPVPDCLQSLKYEKEIIRRDSVINIYPYVSLTEGENGKKLSSFDEMKDEFTAISDDGKGVENLTLLHDGAKWAAAHGKLIASHAEAVGYGASPEAEIIAVERELKVAAESGCKYHFCHISTEQSFELIKSARKQGVDVTCEVTPHHLALCEEDINNDTNYKMNPPLRSRRDMAATVNALLDGTATIIATDHAPHAPEDKNVPYLSAPNGIIGFETMLPVCYTLLVKSGLATYKRFLEWTVYNPAERAGVPFNKIAVGERADVAVLDIAHAHTYQKEEIKSKACNSPFIGKSYFGFNRLTLKNGNIIYDNLSGENI